MNKAPASVYNQVTAGSVEDANAYKVVAMLLARTLEVINFAKASIQSGNHKGQGENIGAAITIVSTLQSSLDTNEENEIANNLFSLYDYMTTRLLEANKNNSVELLEEVAQLIKTIKTGWDGIAQEANDLLDNKDATE